MRRFAAMLFALMLVFAACGGSEGATADTAADTTTTAESADAHDDEGDHGDDAHEEGDEHSEDAHEEQETSSEEDDEHSEDAHDEGDETHDEADDAHEEGDEHSEEAHTVEVGEMFVSEENIPEADGEVTAEYEVHMTEFGFDPEHLDLTPGETIRLTLVNEGLLGHEFRLTTEHKAEEHVASGHEDHGDEGGHHEDADIIINVEPGETRVVELTLPADATAINHVACLIPGHYEGGMFGDVTY